MKFSITTISYKPEEGCSTFVFYLDCIANFSKVEKKTSIVSSFAFPPVILKQKSRQLVQRLVCQFVVEPTDFDKCPTLVDGSMSSPKDAVGMMHLGTFSVAGNLVRPTVRSQKTRMCI